MMVIMPSSLHETRAEFKRAQVVCLVVGAVIILAHIVLPASAWLGWTELALMSASGMWIFYRTAGIWSSMRRWSSLLLLVTLGLLLLSLNVWPERQRAATMPMLAIVLLLLAMQQMVPVTPPPR